VACMHALHSFILGNGACPSTCTGPGPTLGDVERADLTRLNPGIWLNDTLVHVLCALAARIPRQPPTSGALLTKPLAPW
jgi:hypothetical protein